MRSDASGNIDVRWSVVTLAATMTWTLGAHAMTKVPQNSKGYILYTRI